MTRLKFIVPVLLLGVLVLVGAGCTGKYSSPEKTLDTLTAAQEAGDVDGYLSCMTDESREWFEGMSKVGSEGELTSESLKKTPIEWDPTKVKVIEKTDDTAVVEEEGKPGSLYFKKEGGDWKIDVIATLQKAYEGLPQQ